MAVSPARMHRISSGKKGNRKARVRNTVVLARMSSWYFSERLRLTRRLAKFRPKTRAREKVSRDPVVTAPKVSRNAGQAPKSSPPAAATILLGMGASTTDRS